MKSIYLVKYGNSDKAFEIRERDIQVPQPDEVIIKTATSGLNFADVIARRGLYPDAPKNPAVLGYDVAGTVHAVGSEVSHLQVGDRVTALSRFGGYSEYVNALAFGAAKIPDTLDFATATALATQACTAYYCAEECTTLNEGDHVLVHAAAGGVGIILTQIAKSKGCKVYGTASTSKLDFIKSNGVDVGIDYTKDNFAAIINKDNDKRGVDVIFDSIGGKVFKKGMKLLSPGGRMISFGAASQINGNKTSKIGAVGVALGFGLYSPIPLLMASKSLITVNMLRIADHRPDVFGKVLKNVISLYEEGIIQPKLSKTFKAEDIASAHDFLESRKSIGKVVLQWHL